MRKPTMQGRNQVEVTFELPAHFPHVPLAVVGDFNQWTPTAHPITQASDGAYRVTVTLATGQRSAFR